ncbi:hypothetical protein [uncultured Clostridium sp.]|uniref:hypothetical protein n=1 Tax=uncultured Clostridium sp. TaxID=59620 RepID=UPI00262E5F1E|nr:hypothetical protein [uncultured Clostridium sp.]
MLKEVIAKLKETGILVRSFGVEEEELIENNKECIVYTFGSVAKSNRFRLDIRIIAKDLERCLEIKKQIETLFVGVGDTVKVKKCTKIDFEGGSSAREFETKTVHLLFTISFWGRG